MIILELLLTKTLKVSGAVKSEVFPNSNHEIHCIFVQSSEGIKHTYSFKQYSSLGRFLREEPCSDLRHKFVVKTQRYLESKGRQVNPVRNTTNYE